MTLDLAQLVADELERRPDLLERLAQLVTGYAATSTADSPLLTAGQAAARAGVHPETVRRAIRAGVLPTAGRVGRSPRLDWRDVEAWLNAGRKRSITGASPCRPRGITLRRGARRPLARALADKTSADD